MSKPYRSSPQATLLSIAAARSKPIPHIFELNRSAVTGVGINVPTSAEPASPIGAAAYHDTAVWLKPAG